MNETAAEIACHVQATRYLSGAGLVLLLYDHLLTFSAEIELIWAAHWSVPKVLFLLIRYLVPSTVIIHIHLLSGIANSHVSNTLRNLLYLFQISVGISNFLVLLHLWNLWERTPRFICWTLAFFVLTLYFNHALRTCVMMDRARVLMLWAPCMAFEVTVLSAMVYNALSRPRCPHTAVAKVLYHDGITYFIESSLFGVV
ncbi:uncharacterized protein BT62DRAFT_66471 [Guyanagaster necrorhizus]|uniref:DUF6533 domain-containing protein n=1 Tax=Guyanagaster necrorhizus TaxID=856835 RepID=A0A9P8ATG9_9AGAR|nr:uncharacterized protein BT62DRAFT_66471 [Guyanagaster necrorhizus MCA 3950]KAG7447185.1 hypothetical protein BT62DRAFT_66471 [Guyanagaster necrorhizus MCA 3950]